MKLKKGDQIVVLRGKDAGRKGKIEKVYPKVDKVLIPGMNVSKKHMKASQGKPGGIIDLVKPMFVSKVALVCPKCGKPTRVGYEKTQTEKHRICRKCKSII